MSGYERLLARLAEIDGRLDDLQSEDYGAGQLTPEYVVLWMLTVPALAACAAGILAAAAA